MNKMSFSTLFYCGVVVVLVACQGAGQSQSAAMFKPGDAIDGMGLATGAADAPPLWAFCSGPQGSSHNKTFNCRAPMLPTLAIGHVFLFADEALTGLDWSDLAWELSIDGQAIELESFGTFDYVMPSTTQSPSPVRKVFMKGTAWNIVLTNLNPGDHMLWFLAQSETDRYTWSVDLVIEGTDGTDISSVPFPPKS